MAKLKKSTMGALVGGHGITEAALTAIIRSTDADGRFGRRILEDLRMP